MEATETRRAARYTNGARNGGARAFAGCVKIALAFDAALAGAACVVSASWGLALPATGLAVAFIVSAFMLKGGAA